MNCHVCKNEPAACWCPCPLCGKSSIAAPGAPEACGCAYEDLTVALRADRVYAGACTKALQAIVTCDDEAKHAKGKAGATLNGYGLVDLFDCVNHPLGAGEHKQQPYRSQQLDAALEGARAALAQTIPEIRTEWSPLLRSALSGPPNGPQHPAFPENAVGTTYDGPSGDLLCRIESAAANFEGLAECAHDATLTTTACAMYGRVFREAAKVVLIPVRPNLGAPSVES